MSDPVISPEVLEGFTPLQQSLILEVAGDPRRNVNAAAKRLGIDRHHASKIANRPDVQEIVGVVHDEFVRGVAERVVITAADVLDELWHVARTAKSDTAKVRALELLGRNLGLQFDRDSGVGDVRTIVVRREAS